MDLCTAAMRASRTTRSGPKIGGRRYTLRTLALSVRAGGGGAGHSNGTTSERLLLGSERAQPCACGFSGMRRECIHRSVSAPAGSSSHRRSCRRPNMPVVVQKLYAASRQARVRR